MTAKHRPHQPKRQRSTSDLERRVRRLERNYKADAKGIATHVARVEIDQAMREHTQDKHGGMVLTWREDSNGALGHPRFNESGGD